MIKVKDFFSIEDFKNTLNLSILGARVCYSSKSLEELLKDKRITDKESRINFIEKLIKHKHYSVFSHSFAYKNVGELNALKIGATKFKSEYNPEFKDVIGVSLRHLIEELTEDEIKKSLNEIKEIETKIEIIDKEENVYLLHLNTDYSGYAMFYIEGISRIATHQLVRHTSLNFSQRSQRYVNEKDNEVYIPDTIQNQNVIESFKALDRHLQKLYDKFVNEYKIKIEDARYILPSGRKSTIVVSGTLRWINDFIEKRLDNHAQKEIRDIAYRMKNILDRVIKSKKFIDTRKVIKD